MKAKRVHECRVCGYQGSVTAGTIFHKTRVPLRDWLWAIYRRSQGKKGISAVQLIKEIGVSYPTAWLMQHKIRRALAEGEKGPHWRGLVEVDEGYVGEGRKVEGGAVGEHKPRRWWRWRLNIGVGGRPGAGRGRADRRWR